MKDDADNLNRCSVCGQIFEVGPDQAVPNHSVLRGGRIPCDGADLPPLYDEHGLPREPKTEEEAEQ